MEKLELEFINNKYYKYLMFYKYFQLCYVCMLKIFAKYLFSFKFLKFRKLKIFFFNCFIKIFNNFIN